LVGQQGLSAFEEMNEEFVLDTFEHFTEEFLPDYTNEQTTDMIEELPSISPYLDFAGKYATKLL
jgi:hypothetical protein